MAFSFTVTDAERIAAIDLIGDPAVLPGQPGPHPQTTRQMLTYDAFHWDWYHLGLADLLDAVRARLRERAGHPDIAAEHYTRPAARVRNTAGRDYLTKQAA